MVHTDIPPPPSPGDRRVLSRTLTWLEDGDPRGLSVPGAPRRGVNPAHHVLGVTGAPGAGKSTLTSRLIRCLRDEGATVAVLAVDPSSPVTGGALLGDRIRMSEHLHDEGVYIRSIASRGQRGGSALVVTGALRLLASHGFDWSIVETVGVGQVEVDIAEQVDTTLLVVSPGAGDDVQASKAGLLEVADVIAVNKADQPGADGMARDLRNALDLSMTSDWRVPVECCSAQDGTGIDVVMAAVKRHRSVSTEQGVLGRRRTARRRIMLRDALKVLAGHQAHAELLRERPDLVSAVSGGELDPIAAAQEFLASRGVSTDSASVVGVRQ